MVAKTSFKKSTWGCRLAGTEAPPSQFHRRADAFSAAAGREENEPTTAILSHITTTHANSIIPR
jgi:hypothetical protein